MGLDIKTVDGNLRVAPAGLSAASRGAFQLPTRSLWLRNSIASLSGALEHEIATPFARVDQGELALSYPVLAYPDPSVGPEKSDNLFFRDQVIKHIGRDASFLAIGKYN